MAALTAWLKFSGARKSDGTPVASGTVYFYQPGTTNTQVTVYSDKDGTTAITQPLTLAVRLYANILAGHLIIFVFLSFILYFGTFMAVISVPAAVIFFAFEIFVAVLQAYIFAILTQVYIELAMFREDH